MNSFVVSLIRIPNYFFKKIIHTMLKLSSILLCVLSISFLGYSQTKKTSLESLYDIKIRGIDGEIIDLNLYRGKKILFVNVASECGFTNQYKGLQALYSKYKEKLVVIGLPCNQFNGQEPGSELKIKTFCRLNYGVNFPMTSKINVKGKNQHSLYQWLTMKVKNGKKNSSVRWNFQKYLIDEKGQLIEVFYSSIKYF